MIRSNKSKRMRWARNVACMIEVRDAYKIRVRKSKAKRLLRRPRHRWDDKIQMHLMETERRCGLDASGSE
jgi:hypothetical protein